MRRWGRNRGGGGGWGSDGRGVVTRVAVVAVVVTTIEVVAAEAAMVGVVTRSLQRWWAEGCSFSGDVVAGERGWPACGRGRWG